MAKEQSPHIAIVGMYGGMWREYNPGCFMIGHKTKQELQKRITGGRIDAYSIDNKLSSQQIERESLYGFDINFFGREQQIDLLNNTLAEYDAIVVGGDIVWGGDDVVEDNDIFFVNSPDFLRSSKPAVLFNCVHTFYDDETIHEQRYKFAQAIKRATYTSVRTQAIQQRLERMGICNVHYVPDPVLDVDMSDFPNERVFLPTERDKPILGVSVRGKLSTDLLSVLGDLPLDDYEVVVFPFSRQYRNLETLRKVQATFGNRFQYFDQYLDPVQSYQFVGELDMFLNDTYHGIIASILHGKPFISLDVETELTSRKHQLLEAIGVDQRYNVRLAYSDPQNVSTIQNEVPGLLQEPVIIVPETMQAVKSQIQRHYDAMAQHIMEGASSV